MPMTAEEFPDDRNALKVMVLSHEAENDRVHQVIKELERHRFGRRAETFPKDEPLLALEEAEQNEADALEDQEHASNDLHREQSAKRRVNRGALLLDPGC